MSSSKKTLPKVTPQGESFKKGTNPRPHGPRPPKPGKK